MKKILLISSLLALNPAYAEKHVKEDGKVIITETINGAKVYGNHWKTDTEVVAIDAVLNDAEMNIGEQLTFTGNIGKVCQSKGCWMTLEQNGMFARVDFNNHSFFIPKDSSGKAEVYGTLKSNMMSEEKRKHIEAEGSGKLPKKMFEIKATSVKIHP